MNDNSFYSMDRLLQFGMEIGVAQQMMKSMNSALQNTTIPGPYNAQVAAPAHQYWLVLDEKQAGPFSGTEVTRLFTEGRLRKDTWVWRSGLPAWQKAGEIADVLRLIALAPPPFPGAPA